MAKFNIIIADYDKGYINAISRYLSTYENNYFNVIAFSSSELLLKHLTSSKADILLISPEMMDVDYNLSNIQVVIINIEDRIPESLMDYPNLNKYQPGDLIVKQIINIFSQQSKDEIIEISNTNQAKLIGVYSPIGGIGKTVTSISLGKKYAMNNYRTLFLSLEELASYSQLLDCNSNNDFSDLIYYIKQKNKNLLLKIEGLKNNDINSGLHYFSPPLCYEDVQQVSVDEWIHLIQYLKEKSSYERIILDFDCQLTMKNIKLLQSCDDVYMLVNGDSLSICKIDRMYSNLEKMNIRNLNDNTNIIYNNNTNKSKEIMEGASIRGKDITTYLPYDNDLSIHINNNSYVNLEGCFGNALNKLIR